jgi:hypothetical protein
MATEKRKAPDALEPAIKVLILQEVRLLQMEPSFAPPVMVEEISRSIQEAKREISGMVGWVGGKERNTLIKEMLRQSLDEEIERAIEVRQNRCLRCVHARYHDIEGADHVDLPSGDIQIHGIGCSVDGQTPGAHCAHYTLSARGVTLGGYLEQMTLLYKVREMFDEMEEIWDYLTK